MRPGPQRSPRQPAGQQAYCELLVYALKPLASTVAVGMFQTGYGRLSFEHRTDGALGGPQSATGTTTGPHFRRIVLRRCPSALGSVELINHLEEGSLAPRGGLDTDHKSEPSLRHDCGRAYQGFAENHSDDEATAPQPRARLLYLCSLNRLAQRFRA